ncbi:MAG: AAA family ATPase [Candidatus Bipolaricaulaceae bacterium]
MAKVYAVSNQKGGVGKTTTCLCLGDALAERGKRVLLVDLDPQAGLTTILGFSLDSSAPSIHEVLVGQIPLSKAILKTKSGALELVPSKVDLAGAEALLLDTEGWQSTLRMALEEEKHSYDYILLDCPPSLGVLTILALVAADKVIIPVQAEFLALIGLRHLHRLIEEIKKRFNPGLQAKILRTMVDTRTLHNREVVEELEKIFGERVYKAIIVKTIKFADASYARESILRFAPGSKAAQAYRELAKEVMKDEEEEGGEGA